MRDIVVGDVHGCRRALDALLEKVNLAVDADRLILLGDLFDRGSESYEVFERVQALEKEMGERFVLLRGNHEDYLLGEQSFFGRLAWMRVGRGSSVKSFKRHGASYEDCAPWIRQHCRAFWMGEGFCCVHAGLKIYPPELNDSYTLFHDHELVPLNRYAGPLTVTGHIGLEKPCWFAGDKKTVKTVETGVLQPLPEKGVLCIDTGCGKGGRLSAMVVENRQFTLLSVSQDGAKG